MSLSKRIGDLGERGLTPREAVILWMQEAHQFDSLLDYGLWLAEQPEEAFPLIRMPAQVVAAIRSRNKGVRDEILRPQFYQAQKDVLFLYHIHKHVNSRAINEAEAWQLRVEVLTEKLRGLINSTYEVDMSRLRALELPEDLSSPPPVRDRTTDEVALDEAVLDWAAAEIRFWADLEGFRVGVHLLSAGYFGGEELLYPRSRRALETALGLLAGLRETYNEMLDRQAPETDEDFIAWLARDGEDEESKDLHPEANGPEFRPDVTRAAREHARNAVLVARAEALDDLDENAEGVRLVQHWIWSEEGQAALGRTQPGKD